MSGLWFIVQYIDNQHIMGVVGYEVGYEFGGGLRYELKRKTLITNLLRIKNRVLLLLFTICSLIFSSNRKRLDQVFFLCQFAQSKFIATILAPNGLVAWLSARYAVSMNGLWIGA